MIALECFKHQPFGKSISRSEIRIKEEIDKFGLAIEDIALEIGQI
tara:strand:- start:186 stop:320 length:135 start_codon:yes stop_codon:yes gene_type:complete